MKWIQNTISLRDRSFAARYCCDSENDQLVDELYAQDAAKMQKQGDAWFVRRRMGSKVPTGEALNGTPLYKHELVPSELWHIPMCSLQQSIEIVIRDFDCPSLKNCIHHESSRQAIWPFMRTEGLELRAALSLVVYDAWLHFDLLPGAERLTRDAAQRIMDFSLAEFREGSNAKERSMLVRGVVETGTFGIGSV